MRDGTYDYFGYTRLMSIKDVRDLLGVSYDFVYDLVRQRRLTAVSLNGSPVNAEEVGDGVRSLRFYPSDVRDFIKNSELV